MDNFTQAYITAALWASTDEDGEPLDSGYSIDDLAPETLGKMIADCALFQTSQDALLNQAGDDEQNGHDFWLTRNGHGAGFWDRGYDKTVGDELTAESHAYGSCDLYVGDDGLIYAA